MVITKDLGAVSAYAYAVEQGYQGTEEEFAELMARQATVAEEAAASADAAAESASEAQASAEQAEQSAQSISGDVERAEQAATTATGKATEAATSATTANGAAQTATGKAAQAEQSATAAANSASAAATSASNAASSATTAQTAQTAAETAQGKAEDAQAAAEAAAASIDPDTLVKKTELEDYAKIDGSYETMTVGNAEQLVSTVGIDDKVPYLFRTSGGSADIGNRETDKIVGGTVAWNQLVEATSNSRIWATIVGMPSYSQADNSVTFTYANSNPQARARIGNMIASHDHLISLTFAPSTSTTATRLEIQTDDNEMVKQLVQHKPFASGKNVLNYIVKLDADNPSARLYIAMDYNNATVGDTCTISNIMNIDLTQLFGSTVADYIFNLETATAGAGVAYFRKLFPKDYYEYNAGKLLSVNTSQHKMVGFNAYNPETGTAHVVGGNQYQITGAYTALSIDGETVTPDASGFFTPSADGTLTVTGGNSTTTCVHLVWDGERDDTYEPYEEWVYPLDSSLTLRGIPKLDASNNLYYDGDTYAPDGTVTRRYGMVDLGTLTSWKRNNTSSVYNTSLPIKERTVNGISATLTVVAPSVSSSSMPLNSIKFADSGGIVVKMDGINVSNASTMLSGVYLVYELATPTTETADPFQNPQNVDDFGTEEYVTDSIVPVGHETFYQANLKAKLEMAPNSPDGDGDYIVRQANGLNSYVPLAQVKELPDLPTEDGTYVLKATVSSGTPTYTWVSDAAESEG